MFFAPGILAETPRELNNSNNNKTPAFCEQL